MHSDGVQAAGKIPVDVQALGVDLYSISGHKFYATKGIGALYVKTGAKLRPIQFGGKHERERRPGTENVPSALAMAKAASIARSTLPIEPARLKTLRDRLGNRNPGACSGRRRKRRKHATAHPTPRISFSTDWRARRW